MKSNPQKIHFPVWQYLTQPLFDADVPAILNPQRFWALYQVRYLERCWSSQYQPEQNRPNLD